MASESDRIARAGDYVFGLMDERERARAERDLETDPAFRATVLRLASHLRELDPSRASSVQSEERWRLVQQRLAELPQMRPAGMDESDSRPSPPPAPISRVAHRPYGVGINSLGGRRGLLLAIALLVAFALGYLVGVS